MAAFTNLTAKKLTKVGSTYTLEIDGDIRALDEKRLILVRESAGALEWTFKSGFDQSHAVVKMAATAHDKNNLLALPLEETLKFSGSTSGQFKLVETQSVMRDLPDAIYDVLRKLDTPRKTVSEAAKPAAQVLLEGRSVKNAPELTEAQKVMRARAGFVQRTETEPDDALLQRAGIKRG